MNKKLLFILTIPIGCTTLHQSNYGLSNRYRSGDAKIVAAQRRSDQEQNRIDRQRILAKKRELDRFSDLSEGPLYGELVDRYESNDRWGYNEKYKIFISRYPKSIRREEALYMKGLLEFAEHNYGLALLQFNKIIKEYPNGKRRAAALLAKGATFRRMNLAEEAIEIFKLVSRQYAGRIEASRAKLELQTINK